MSASILQPNPASGLGYWPAFWAMGGAARPVGATNWPSIGEFDIAEDVNALSKHSTTFHCGCGRASATTPTASPVIFSRARAARPATTRTPAIIDRTNTAAEQLRFYLDGSLTFTVNENQVSVATWQAAVDHGFMAISRPGDRRFVPRQGLRLQLGRPVRAASASGAAMSVDWSRGLPARCQWQYHRRYDDRRHHRWQYDRREHRRDARRRPTTPPA
ncbi:hypothetical protein ACRAWF_01440 [Streptomyces sp. L7]